ncbi:DUF397 domain-containing protein [Saccharopolyspora griseoalba]|uniref:DUF397 domain-containing protein n=1 Tax=Saccharopolyspora griseoalba TaxID=1431848 RepID=A0ABW2LM43_9PSEU
MRELAELADARWITSSYSSSGVNCVEVAVTPRAVGVRDSKNRAAGTLTFHTRTWSNFLDHLKR